MQEGAQGGRLAHNKHAGHDPDAFRRQFWIVLILTISVVIWSDEVQHWLGYMAPMLPGSEWIPAVLGSIIFAYGGKVFLIGARTELGDRQPEMMTLISLAIVVAFVASWAATTRHHTTRVRADVFLGHVACVGRPSQPGRCAPSSGGMRGPHVGRHRRFWVRAA